MRENSPWRLVVSDLDGTLVTGTTALEHLRGWLQHRSAFEGLEQQLALGQVTDRDVAQACAPFYRGVALADAVKAMTPIARIGGIEQGVALLRQRAVDTMIATVSWSFAARAMADHWGFAHACGADLEVDASGLFTGHIARHFPPEDKAEFVLELCHRGGFEPEQVVAIGDGRSDLPLFTTVGFSVALNASAEARAAASVAVDDASFVAALRAVPGLLA